MKKRYLLLGGLLGLATVAYASVTVSVNGTNYSIPQKNEKGWGDNVTAWIQAISSNTLQPSGGTFSLTADADFGGAAGLKSLYFKSRSSNIAASGAFRLANTDLMGWRNTANSGDLLLGVDTSDRLTFNGSPFLPTTALTASRALQSDASGVLSASSVTSTELGYLSGVTASLCGAGQTCTLTGKTISGASNTLSNIGYSSLSLSGSIVNSDISSSAAIARSKVASGTASHVVINDGSGNLSSEAQLATTRGGTGVSSTATFPSSGTVATVPTAGLVRSTGTALSSGYANLTTDVTGTLPVSNGGTGSVTAASAFDTLSPNTTKGDITVRGASSNIRLPVGSDGQVLVGDSTQTGGVKWTTLQQGSKNYISYGTFENNATTGWSLVHSTLDSTSKLPNQAHGSWTSAAGTLALSTVGSGSQLAGSYSLSYASSAATTAGDMVVSQAYTIDSEDQAKVLSFKLYYKLASGTADFSGTSSNSFGIAVYDRTNSTWIQPAGVWALTQSSGIGIAQGTIQTASNTSQLQLAIYNANATSGAATLYVDDVTFGPQAITQGTPVTDWQSYAPTFTAGWGTTSNVNVKYRRVGDTLHVAGSFQMGTPAASYGGISLPSGLTIDTSKFSSSSQTMQVGQLTRIYTGGTPLPVYNGTSSMAFALGFNTTRTNEVFAAQNVITSQLSADNLNSYFSANDTISFSFSVPIQGWSSQVQMSSDTDTRVVAARVHATGSHSIAANTETVIPFDATDFDTHGGISGLGTSSFKYSVPVSGYYRVEASATVTGSTTAQASTNRINVQKNGSVYAALGSNTDWNNGQSGWITPLMGSTVVPCNTGDTLTISLNINEGGSAATSSNGQLVHASFTRLSGPSQIAASETVTAKSSSAPSGSISSSIGSSGSVVFSSMQYDSHGAYSTSTGAYVCNQSETLNVSGQLTTQGTFSINNFADVGLFKNGVQDKLARTYSGGSMSTVTTPFTFDIKCLAGDSITLRGQSNATSPSWVNDAAINWVQFKKIGNY